MSRSLTGEIACSLREGKILFGSLFFIFFSGILYRQVGQYLLFHTKQNLLSPVGLEWAIFSFIFSQVFLAQLLFLFWSVKFIEWKYCEVDGVKFWDLSMPKFWCIISPFLGISVGLVYIFVMIHLRGETPSGWKYTGFYMPSRPYMGFIQVVVFALVSISEELYFRGIWYPFFRKRLGWGASSVISSIVFVLMHTHILRDPIQISIIFLFAVLLCILLERVRTIFPIVIIHMTANTIIGIISYCCL